MVGKALPRGCQAHPPALGFDQPGTGFLRERGDLLRHGGRGQVIRLGNRAHGTQPRQAKQQLQSPGVHDYRIRLSEENPSAIA